MSEKKLLNSQQINLTLHRLALSLIEHHQQFNDTVLISIQPRGVIFADKIIKILHEKYNLTSITYGKLDVSFYRDDIHQEANIKSYPTDILFSVENKNVVLIDDVLYTGRTIRAAMDALQDFGRAKKIELCILVDRKFSRQVPIQADYCGIAIDSTIAQKVKVRWSPEFAENEIIII